MALLVNDVTPRVQYTATASQTVFAYPFAIFADANLKVYQTLSGATANDATDLLTLTTHYTVSGAGLLFRDTDVTGFGYTHMIAKLKAGASVGWAITPDTSSTTYESGTAFFTSLSKDITPGSEVTYSFDLQGTGDPSINVTA